jgi:hypothetical protein
MLLLKTLERGNILRTIDRIRSLSLKYEEGVWKVYCGYRSTPSTRHRLIAVEDQDLVTDKLIPIKRGYHYYWIVAHLNGEYDLYSVSFSRPKSGNETVLCAVLKPINKDRISKDFDDILTNYTSELISI